MRHLIGLAKSAHLLGIRRSELQRLIQQGELHTFEGCVDLDELRQRFPALALDETSLTERLSFLRETAFSRRVRETVLPEAEELAPLLKKRTADWAIERARAEKYCSILRDVAGRISKLQGSATPETRAVLDDLNRWLLSRLEAQ